MISTKKPNLIEYLGAGIQILSGTIAILTYLTTGTLHADSATGLFGLYAIGGGVSSFFHSRLLEHIHGDLAHGDLPEKV